MLYICLKLLNISYLCNNTIIITNNIEIYEIFTQIIKKKFKAMDTDKTK
jgi:hypothetical protein